MKEKREKGEEGGLKKRVRSKNIRPRQTLSVCEIERERELVPPIKYLYRMAFTLEAGASFTFFQRLSSS